MSTIGTLTFLAQVISSSVHPQSCRQTQLMNYYQGNQTVTTPDVTGDGVSDAWTLELQDPTAPTRFRLQHRENPKLCINNLDHLIGITPADVNGDQVDDLVVGIPWNERTIVVFGPIESCVDSKSASLDFYVKANPGGLSSLFGIAATAVDADGDGIIDVIIGAPGEREEGCFGQIAPRVFYGPFLRSSYESEDGKLLPSPSFRCLGDSLQCDENHLKISSPKMQECYRYPLPIDHARMPEQC